MGVLAWKRGALLVSFVWVAMLVMAIDRHWSLAAVWAMIGAAFALVGLIHVPEAGFDTFSEPVWEQCASTDDCWEYGEQWMFFVAYLMLAATFGLIGLARKYGGDSTLLPPVIDEESDQGFSDWFADAGVDTSKIHWKQEAELAAEKDPDKTAHMKGEEGSGDDEISEEVDA